jgi:hypothetical protein
MDYAEKIMTEQQEKLAAMDNVQGAKSTGATTLGYDANPKRDSMTERFRHQIRRASRERSRTSQLEELVFLLDKNPEIARILDLIDAIGRD